MKLTYKDKQLQVGEIKPFNSVEIFSLLSSFGVKDYKCNRTDRLLIEVDKELTQQQQQQLKDLLDTYDITKAKVND